jgi:glycine/D-amino acid oxidase-like deaminating enzyme/nitrite reductase/ring-hydroxylating ferredoxin subunit
MPTSTRSIWVCDDPALTAAPLAEDRTYDVCVIGGGIAGLTTAYFLATEGKKVVVLEGKPAVANGETAFTTAHLAWVLDDRFARLASIRGDDVARAAAASHRAAIATIEEIAGREGIDCDLQRLEGHLFPGADGPDALMKELEALKRLELPFELIERPPVAGFAGPCLLFDANGQFHPLKYLAGLAAAIRGHGGVIHTDTRAVHVDGGSPCVVRTQADYTVTAGAVVVATNAPFDAGVLLHTKLAAYNTYAVAFEVPRRAVPPGLYWDTEDPYHYVRTQPGEGEIDFLIAGGEDHKTGQAGDQAERWDRLVGWTTARIPAVGPLRYHWSGQVFETPDGLGLIGAAPWGRNVFVITGDSGMGMTHGTLGARLVANLIAGKDDPLAAVYDPSRWMPGAALTLVKENLNLAAQYTAWLSGGDVSSVEEIPPGQGAVVRRGLSKLAVYRDTDGSVCQMSAACPHMGGVVQWNPGERTWDCPAHGSRFRCTGEVIHGPAVQGLKAEE